MMEVENFLNSVLADVVIRPPMLALKTEKPLIQDITEIRKFNSPTPSVELISFADAEKYSRRYQADFDISMAIVMQKAAAMCTPFDGDHGNSLNSSLSKNVISNFTSEFNLEDQFSSLEEHDHCERCNHDKDKCSCPKDA